MMKRWLLMALFLGGAGTLSADLYLRGGLFYEDGGDLSVQSTERFAESWDSGTGFSAALGYRFSVLRVEGEVVYYESSLNSLNEVGADLEADLERLSAFGNVFIEMPGFPFLNPYLGAGIGVTQIDVRADGTLPGSGLPSFAITSSADEMKLSFQLMAGVRASVAETLSVYAGVRYLALDDLGFDDATDTITLSAESSSLALELGVAIGF